MDIKKGIKISTKQFWYLVFVLAAFLYGLTAYKSVGYYHPDEQYQLIEFAGIKLGTHAIDEVAWEYNAKIRPALQPTLCYLVFRVAAFFKITDPFLLAFLLRLLTAAFTLLVLTVFIQNTRHWFRPALQRPYILLSYFLWFGLYLGVRFSSETWAGLSFMLALAFWYGNRKYKFWYVGALMGVSFLFRYQMGFAWAGFVLWLGLVQRTNWKNLLIILLLPLPVMLFGVALDFWFYGEFTLTPVNYLMEVVDSGGKGFGTSPPLYYLKELIRQPGFILGLPLVLALLLGLWYYPLRALVWCLLPFVLIHQFIPHKEIRFLFPWAFFAPVILLMVYHRVSEKWLKKDRLQRLIQVLVAFMFLGNGLAVVVVASKSADVGKAAVMQAVNASAEAKKHLVYLPWANPYDQWSSIPTKFYVPEQLSWQEVKSINDLHDSLLQPNAANFFVCRRKHLAKKGSKQQLEEKGYQLQLASMPEWMVRLEKLGRWNDSQDILYLYRWNNNQTTCCKHE